MHKPTHDEIVLQARWIWRDRGCPEGSDEQIWLEAERQLGGADTKSPGKAREEPLMERVKHETAAESMVEYHISPAVSEQEAIKATMMKQEASDPKAPKQNQPRPKPPEPGKPLWNDSPKR